MKLLWQNPIFRERMSESHKGHRHSEATKKKIGLGNKGKSVSAGQKERVRFLLSGEKTHLWKGGISFEEYSPLFNQQLKDRIRVRDNFICQICGVPELECDKRLSAHHKDYDKKNNELSNLISLCCSCHAKTGQNRKYWIKHFEEVIYPNPKKPNQ